MSYTEAELLWLEKYIAEIRDPERLEEMSTWSHRRIRAEVAANPATPAHVLSRFARSRDAALRWSVAGNPSLDAESIERLARSRDTSILFQLAQNPATNATTLQRLARRRGGIDNSDQEDSISNLLRESVAKHPNTPPEVLEKLSDDERLSVTYFAIRNPNMPEESLARFADDPNEIVRICLARKQFARSGEILQKLACDESRFVRWVAASNPLMPDDILKKLAEDPEEIVRKAASRRKTK
jgi:hypothetical protein